MREFFELLYGDSVGYACISRLNPLDENAAPRDRYFEYPAQLDEMVKFCTRWGHADVYTTSLLTDGNGRTKRNMTVGHVAHGDADLFPVSGLKLDPSIVVHTSPDKTHVYWLIEDTTDPAELEALSHGVSSAHPKDTTGYDTGWASNKLLRVPGTSNNKYEVPYEVHYEVTGVTYTKAEFEAVYPAPKVAEVVNMETADIPTREEAIEGIGWTVKLEEIIQGTYFANQGYSRYEVLHLAQQELFRCGASNEQAFAILQHHSLNKWYADGISKSDERLWDDIIRARAQSELSNSELLGEFDDDLLPPQEEYMFEFLSPEEKASLKPTFVDKFVNWSAGKTSTARCFQEAAAFGLLSTVLSELGHIPMHFGKERLNMWFIAGGRSTIDRKSTVKRHMLSVLSLLSDDEEYNYNLGSDFTVQGLSDALLDKPNRSGIVYVDEFQGFLDEMGKNYMAGTKGQLTDMFDGHIRGKLRSTATVKKRSEVEFSLSFYALGIAQQIASKLTEEDFYSGFLTRFLWIMPPSDYVPPSITDGYELAPEETRATDSELVDIAQILRQARTYFEQFTDGLDAPTQPLDVAPEAHERMRKHLKDIEVAARRIGKEQILSSGQRLNHATYKAAGLLAMVECSERIELEHVLTAISYSNAWFGNLITMANSISSTQWNRQLDEVVELLNKRNGEMQYGALYREFKAHYKPKDFKDMLTALEESGFIKLRSEAGRTFVTSKTV